MANYALLYSHSYLVRLLINWHVRSHKWADVCEHVYQCTNYWQVQC